MRYQFKTITFFVYANSIRSVLIKYFLEAVGLAPLWHIKDLHGVKTPCFQNI